MFFSLYNPRYDVTLTMVFVSDLFGRIGESHN